ncbi:hypothetical protein I7I48_02592 [Histoplasma ohiense]|nr:hypothetical protein I7I48_02592 [Histoplasma ohiense (nom. inval.)]
MSIKPLREKIKRVFSRSGSLPTSSPPQTSKNSKNQKSSHPKSGYWSRQAHGHHKKGGIKPSKPKIELYKAHEIPRSKYRGPFDEAHIKRLAAYSISGAMLSADRPRSMLSELSPMGTRAPPSRRGSVTSEGGIVQYIDGGVGATNQSYHLMPSDGASDARMVSSSLFASPPTTTAISEQQGVLGGGPNSSHSTGPRTPHPVDVNMSSSTLLTLQTQDTLPTQAETVLTIPTINPIHVSEAEKEAVSPSSMSQPVSPAGLSSALKAIELRS